MKSVTKERMATMRRVEEFRSAPKIDGGLRLDVYGSVECFVDFKMFQVLR